MQNQKSTTNLITKTFILILVVGSVIYFLFDSSFSSNLNLKTNIAENTRVAKALRFEAENFFDINDHYGNIIDTENQDNCTKDGTFLSTVSAKEFIRKNNLNNLKCFFSVSDEKIKSWAINIVSEGSAFCFDSMGNVKKESAVVDSFLCI